MKQDMKVERVNLTRNTGIVVFMAFENYTNLEFSLIDKSQTVLN